MNRDELLQLYDMTFDEKVIMLFKMFPKKQSYIEEVIESFPLLHERGIKISSSFDFTYYIEIDTKGLCSFRKYWERDDYTDKRIHRFSYCVEEGDITMHHMSPVFDKASSDLLCDRALPYMLSCGENLRDIPLIMHDFPDFATFALKHAA